MKQRDFIAVYGPGLLSKPADLQTPRARLILSQVSNWRCVVNTDGGLWSVLESKQAARILTVRIPETNFYAVLRLYESHKAYEKDLARLKAHNGNWWKEFQKEFRDQWSQGVGWQVFCGDSWVPKEMYLRMAARERAMFEEEEERGGEVHERVVGRKMEDVYWAHAKCGRYGAYGGYGVAEEEVSEGEDFGEFI